MYPSRMSSLDRRGAAWRTTMKSSAAITLPPDDAATPLSSASALGCSTGGASRAPTPGWATPTLCRNLRRHGSPPRAVGGDADTASLTSSSSCISPAVFSVR
eukprot:7014806-Prymnesium_polylepis.2